MTGIPGTLRPATEHHAGMTAEGAKALGLESILWVARTQARRRVQLTGVHARASRLSADWWLMRTHWPIESIISAVEKEAPVSKPEIKGAL